MNQGRTLTGAWIETYGHPSHEGDCHVAPSRVRGLKRDGVLVVTDEGGRTLTGAWIETRLLILIPLKRESHPHGCVD